MTTVLRLSTTLLVLGMLGGCDPISGVTVRLQHPGRTPVENATVAVACEEGVQASGATAIRTTPDGKAHLGGLGHVFPIGCDIYVAKPGFATQRIRYRDLCPDGPDGCDRVFELDLVLEPLDIAATASRRARPGWMQ